MKFDIREYNDKPLLDWGIFWVIIIADLLTFAAKLLLVTYWGD